MKNFATPFTHPAPAASRAVPNPTATVRSRWWRAAAGVALAAMTAGAAPADAGKRPKAPHCGGGYYVIDGAPLLGNDATDALLLGAGTASTLSGCPQTAPAIFRALPGRHADGDLLVVRWPSCGGAKRVVLRATIGADCSSVGGVVKGKGLKRRSFTAHQQLPKGLDQTWGSTADGMPAGADVVNPADFVAASHQPGFRLVSPNTASDDEAAAAAADRVNQQTIADFVQRHPERADLMSTGVDPNDPDLKRTADGNYVLTIRDADGNPTDIVTMGPRSQRAVRAEAIRSFPTRDNQLAIYAQRWAFAKDALQMDLPSPDEVATWSVDDVAALNGQVAAQYPNAEASAPLPGEELPSSYPARCGLEIGAGDGTDGSGYCRHATDGLWNRATWPLKYYDTCVKNQANRGSCVAFAITAGREMQVAHKYDRWINLSEQQLYYGAKTIYQPALYGDGLDGSGLMQQLLDAHYEQPLESTWDYNPSNSRTADDKTATYGMSCTGYGGDQQPYCSDTAGQGRLICVAAGPAYVCAIIGAPITGVTVHSLDQPAELWDAGNPDDSLINTLYAVYGTQNPVVLGFDVVSSFDNPDANGFVPFDANRAKVCGTKKDSNECDLKADCQCSRGGHAALLVGYLANAKLPEGAPKGSGGGYLIVKNSWGCAGDGGYYYLPVDWAKHFFYSARAMGQVETSAPLPDQPFDDYHFDFTPTPPNVHVVQPLVTDHYVAGQQIPLVVDGADFQYDQYALRGTTTWTSDLQGQIGSGTNTLTTLVQGTHHITVTYVGKTGAIAKATTTAVVGPKPVNLPPTPVFVGYTLGAGAQCPIYCPYNCVLTSGYGQDAEDGLITSDAQVKWYMELNSYGRDLKATGAASGLSPKFLGCIRPCGGTFTFTLAVTDSAGQTTESRQQLSTAACIN